MRPLIKKFNEFDSANIYALVSDAYQTSPFMSETLEEKFPDLEALERHMNELSSRPGAIAIVAEQEGVIYGYLTIMPRYQAKLRHTADLNMGVRHAARGKGIGTLLLREALRQAEESGELEIIYLMVRADNLSAIRLYENSGFEHVAQLDHDIKTIEGYYNGLLMRKFVIK